MRIYHPYTAWEEYKHGMWKQIVPDDSMVLRAVTFMHDTRAWGKSMMDVSRQWKHSCEQNLSHEEHNRIAWIGQASVCMAIGLPEAVTRKAWWHLTAGQQSEANYAATSAIIDWEKRNA